MCGKARIYKVSLAQPNYSISPLSWETNAIKQFPFLQPLPPPSSTSSWRRTVLHQEEEDLEMQWKKMNASKSHGNKQSFEWKCVYEDDNLKAQPAWAWDCWEWQEPREDRRAKPVETPAFGMPEISLLNLQLPPASVCLVANMEMRISEPDQRPEPYQEAVLSKGQGQRHRQ